MPLLNKTTVFCNACKTSHPGFIESSEDNKIIGRVACPLGERAVELSGDARLFVSLRRRGFLAEAVNAPPASRKLLNLVDITDACNFKCPICFVHGGAKKSPAFISSAEVDSVIAKIKASGGRRVTLFGGEPTEHPDLESITQRFASSGLQVIIATNGLRFAQDAGLALRLKNKGLFKLVLQFDTFDEELHLKMRGNKFIQEKMRAAHSAAGAGLKLGFVCTVNSLNIGEINSVLKYALGFLPYLETVVFQAAAPEGRYDLPAETIVDKERIARQLLDSTRPFLLKEEDIRPIPVFRPWSLFLHPDCGVNIILLRCRGELCVLNYYLDVTQLYAKLAKNKMRPGFFSRNIMPLWYLLQCSKLNLFETLRLLFGLMVDKSNYSYVIVGIGSFVPREFQDMQRIGFCPTAHYRITSGCEDSSPCGFTLQDNAR